MLAGAAQVLGRESWLSGPGQHLPEEPSLPLLPQAPGRGDTPPHHSLALERPGALTPVHPMGRMSTDSGVPADTTPSARTGQEGSREPALHLHPVAAPEPSPHSSSLLTCPLEDSCTHHCMWLMGCTVVMGCGCGPRRESRLPSLHEVHGTHGGHGVWWGPPMGRPAYLPDLVRRQHDDVSALVEALGSSEVANALQKQGACQGSTQAPMEGPRRAPHITALGSHLGPQPAEPRKELLRLVQTCTRSPAAGLPASVPHGRSQPPSASG